MSLFRKQQFQRSTWAIRPRWKGSFYWVVTRDGIRVAPSDDNTAWSKVEARFKARKYARKERHGKSLQWEHPQRPSHSEYVVVPST